MIRLFVVAAGGAMSCVVAASALAHHSFAMFDQSRTVSFEGTIVEIEWTNPHVWIHVNVPQEDGSVELWSIELTSVVHLRRRGFPRDQVKVGDEGTFTVNPYYSGEPGGRFGSLELTTGVVYPSR
jgi:hypothetical protein